MEKFTKYCVYLLGSNCPSRILNLGFILLLCVELKVVHQSKLTPQM